MRIVLLVELVLVGLLGTAVWSQLQQRAERIDIETLVPAREPAAGAALEPELDISLRTPVIPALESLTETLERPLFEPGRRPPPEEPEEPVNVVETAPAPPPEPIEPPSVQLDAVVLTGARRLALFSGGAVEALRVTEGGLVEGWTVAEIREHEVVLRKADQEQVLDLRRFEAPPVSSRPPPRRVEPRNRVNTARNSAGAAQGASDPRAASRRVSTTQPVRPRSASDGARADARQRYLEQAIRRREERLSRQQQNR
ncbi:MAG: hypothetical protein KDK91_03540 [Gammaproteobacteria bacterium]|nr:hypothetical protein [Gammaproteobacteria bacterium]